MSTEDAAIHMTAIHYRQYGPITRAKFGQFFPLFKPEASVPTSET